MATETIMLRPATAADADALAELIAQLYTAELPGSLRGPHAGRLRFFRYLVSHELAAGGRGRFLAIGPSGEAIGTASVRYADDMGGGFMPPGFLGATVQALGWADAARFLIGAARAALLAEPPLRPNECFIYSVAVHERHRRQGVGAQMMTHVEELARASGARSAALRVLVSNHGARRLYERLGYRVVSRTPAWADRIGLPSELMRKELR